MAERTTKPFKNSFSGSIGAGMGSLFAPGGKKYYILEHKVSSKYHKAGESQEIIVDNIELGRDPHCQVRFDESFSTVSRHHAAIVKDGDMWKLVQISQTNSTFLNGRPIKTEWYLQNGDEIQLSVNGPKLGFIIPTGNKSTVGSIGLTKRLSLFRQQALRPYRTAIMVLSLLLLLSVGGLVTWSYLKGNEYERLISDAQNRLSKLKEKDVKLEKLIEDSAKEEARLDSLVKTKGQTITRTVIINNGGASELQKYEDDIFFIRAAVFAEYNGQQIFLQYKDGGYFGWSGTGYLLTDGRFVTAKHCVEGWKFDSVDALNKDIENLTEESQTIFLCGLTGTEGVKLGTLLIAQSPSKKIKLLSSQFNFDRSDEKSISVGDGGNIIHATGQGGTDWAYAKIGQKGTIIGDASLSANLPAGSRLEVLGYPEGMSTESGSCMYGSCQTSSRGLNGGLILITGKNYEQGNSGGPVFYCDNGIFKAVGIVSFSVFTTMGGLTPLYNLR